jgi:hypothetical protein
LSEQAAIKAFQAGLAPIVRVPHTGHIRYYKDDPTPLVVLGVIEGCASKYVLSMPSGQLTCISPAVLAPKKPAWRVQSLAGFVPTIAYIVGMASAVCVVGLTTQCQLTYEIDALSTSSQIALTAFKGAVAS